MGKHVDLGKLTEEETVELLTDCLANLRPDVGIEAIVQHYSEVELEDLADRIRAELEGDGDNEEDDE